MTAGHAVSRPNVSFEDARGTITDLVQGETFDAVAVITSRKGAIRGNHYHAETVQVLYLIRGTLEVLTRMPGGPVRREVAEAGDLIRTVPLEHHSMTALEDSVFVVLTRGPRRGDAFEADTFRLERPLVFRD